MTQDPATPMSGSEAEAWAASPLSTLFKERIVVSQAANDELVLYLWLTQVAHHVSGPKCR